MFHHALFFLHEQVLKWNNEIHGLDATNVFKNGFCQKIGQVILEKNTLSKHAGIPVNCNPRKEESLLKEENRMSCARTFSSAPSLLLSAAAVVPLFQAESTTMAHQRSVRCQKLAAVSVDCKLPVFTSHLKDSVAL